MGAPPAEVKQIRASPPISLNGSLPRRPARRHPVDAPAVEAGDLEAPAFMLEILACLRQVPVAMRPRQGGAPSHRPVKAAVYLLRAFVALGFALLRPRVVIPETGGSR